MKSSFIISAMLAVGGAMASRATFSESDTEGSHGKDVHAVKECTNIVIKSEADLASANGCESVNTLTISHTSLTNVMLSNLKRAEVIEVSFNPLLVNLALPQLETATTVRIVNQTVISMLDIGNLRHVETLEIMTNLGLKELVFHGLERAGSIRIIDNLFQSIRGLELESVGNIYIAAHPELKELSFPKLKDVTSGFEVVNNNKNLQVSASEMISANRLILTRLASFQAPQLAAIGSNLEIAELASQRIQLPSLVKVGQTFSIHDNDVLNEISFDKLANVNGDFYIGGNAALSKVLASQFPALENIGGTLQIDGNSISEISLPQLKRVEGAIFVRAASNFDCDSLKVMTTGVVLGETRCGSDIAMPNAPASDSSKDTQTRKVEEKHQGPPAPTNGSRKREAGFASLFACFFFMLF